jgi:proton-translocating NADH-quinone oxidoreductase chain L
MFLSIILLPFVGFCISSMFGRFIGKKGSAAVTIFFMACVIILSGINFYYVGLKNNIYFIDLCMWVTSGGVKISWGFLFDSLSMSMLLMISIVSFLVHLYSVGYMGADPHLPRFMSYLSLFTFFMFILVTGDNFIQLFLGWEGVGLCSYLLINFWFTRIEANKAALKALLMNRIGDFGLLLGILLLFYFVRTVDFSVTFVLAPYFMLKTFSILNYNFEILTFVCLFLFIGSIGKSAQLGLHTWLPSAMEGPTPVSALIHAATMVTAGVFLIIRCSPLFEYAPKSLLFVILIGVSTALFAATVGLVQNDLKKVIAFSTTSQLGYMIFICGLSSYDASFFHLINHAFFKALLFLSAGSVIHAVSGEQDMRKLGGLGKLLPYTYSMMLIGSLALAGFPFLSGFYSKDLILEIAYSQSMVLGHYAYWLGSLAAFLTSFYSFRLIYLTFITKANSYKFYILFIHECSFVLALPLFILAIGSIFGGYNCYSLFIDFGTVFWQNSIYIAPSRAICMDLEFIPLLIKQIPTLLSLSAILFVYLFYKFGIYTLSILWLMRTYTYLNNKWFFDQSYNFYIGTPTFRLAYTNCYKLLDKGILELCGPFGISNLVLFYSKYMLKHQTGFIYNYICLFILGFFIIVSLVNFL